MTSTETSEMEIERASWMEVETRLRARLAASEEANTQLAQRATEAQVLCDQFRFQWQESEKKLTQAAELNAAWVRKCAAIEKELRDWLPDDSDRRWGVDPDAACTAAAARINRDIDLGDVVVELQRQLTRAKELLASTEDQLAHLIAQRAMEGNL